MLAKIDMKVVEEEKGLVALYFLNSVLAVSRIFCCAFGFVARFWVPPLRATDFNGGFA